MNLDWRPEPTPEEREALERALARELENRSDPRGAWWREGVQESVSPEPEPDYVTDCDSAGLSRGGAAS